MKNSIYITVLMGLFAFSSCESWLEEDPQYSLNNKVLFSSESGAQMALNTCYGYLGGQGNYGQFMQSVPVLSSGIAWVKVRGNNDSRLASLEAQANSTDQLDWPWKWMYLLVNETNTFIENIDKSPLSDAIKNQMRGEAKFLRGVAYYNLATMWGDVPLKTSPSKYDAVSIPRTPKQEVFAQVEKDFTEASQELSEKSKDGFTNKWAAKAYLGKLYHTLGSLGDQAAWSKAKVVFDEIYASGVFSLQPKFEDLFVNNLQGSKESIFQINYTTSSIWLSNRGNMQFAAASSVGMNAYGNIRASKAFYDLYRATYPGDPRLEATFLTRFRNLAAGGAPKPQVEPVPTVRDSTVTYPYMVVNEEPAITPPGWKNKRQLMVELPYEDMSNPQNPSIEELNNHPNPYIKPNDKGKEGFVNKMANSSGEYQGWPYFKKSWDPTDVSNKSKKNVILLRYADLLLMMADTYNELGDKQRAIDLADEVLSRARNSGKTPSPQPAKWASTLSKEAITEKIYFERIFELAGEQNMYQIIRGKGTGLFKQLLEIMNAHELTRSQAQAGGETSMWRDRVLGVGIGVNRTLTEDFLKKNLLLPIPQSEIDANSDINYTDNNFGYTN